MYSYYSLTLSSHDSPVGYSVFLVRWLVEVQYPGAPNFFYSENLSKSNSANRVFFVETWISRSIDFFGNRLFYFQTNPINKKHWKKSEK